MKFLFFAIFVLFCSHLGNAQSIFKKDSLTLLADSLHLYETYSEALVVRKKAIASFKNAPADYQSYLQAKFYHTNSSFFEFQSYNYHNPDKSISKKAREQYLETALQYAIKARDTYIKVKQPDRIFQYQVQNRIYHQTAYLGNWKEALKQSQLGYQFLKDTLSETDKTFVDLIYDIGYIYSKLGDYSKAVSNYQTSLDLYKINIGENNTDVAQAYNNIAVEYRNLGLRNKELSSLLKAKTIWEKLDAVEGKIFLYRCYGNLVYWYSYYGDFEKAEFYMLKRKKLRESKFAKQAHGFLRNKEEIYQDQLTEQYDLMLHYVRKKDTMPSLHYANEILKRIPKNKKLMTYEVSTLSATLKMYATLISKKDKSKAIELLNEAIVVQEKYTVDYYTKVFPFILYKATLLFESKMYVDASNVLNVLDKSVRQEDIASQFKFVLLKGKVAAALHENKKAKSNFDTAFLLLKNSKVALEKCSINDLKPMISFETINGFVAMGDFYFQLYKTQKQTENLKKAAHRYLLASAMYHQLYLGERYNDQLYNSFNAINQGLLQVAMAKKNDTAFLAKVINAVENNGSKLTWSKFIFNSKRPQLKIPENAVNAEESIKSELNFYQNALVNNSETNKEKSLLWEQKIYELKNRLDSLQHVIKQQNKSYYQFDIINFDIVKLQNQLKSDEAVLKFVQTDKILYSFLISKKEIVLLKEENKAKVLAYLKIGLHNLKNRTTNYTDNFTALSRILLPEKLNKNYKKLIIIPDGALHYFPFEVLLFDKNTASVSYATSLLLLQEQKRSKKVYDRLKIGAFSVSNSAANLPKTSTEIKSILTFFDGKMFVNATKPQFLKEANQFDILHLAMHSFIDAARPEFSALCFANQSNLYISSLYNENFKAEMVVLSACDTGNGFYENGEGVISLSRAFNYAGIPSAVMSLWKVDDEATAKIMTFFYKHLSNGETKDEALKNAKLDYLEVTEDPLLKHPYYWAGFVLSGNTDSLVETKNYWIYVLFIPLFLMICYRKRLLQFFKK